MPHNLYLHSSLVQTRRIGQDSAAKRRACRFNLIDSCVALNGAMLVNAAILILAASAFFKRGIIVTEIQQAHTLLAPLLGTAAASVLFAVALLCSGQSSTLTGTLAGQIVMEGFLNLRIRPWLRRLITRTMAIIPAALTIYFLGDQGSFDLLILSQVILSLQLPFAVLPLVRFTSDRARMGEFVSPMWVRILAWATAILIIGLNVRLVSVEIAKWLSTASAFRFWMFAGLLPVLAAIGLLLLWIAFEPALPASFRKSAGRVPATPQRKTAPVVSLLYRNILVPLDHSDRDSFAISHAAALAKAHGSTVHLLHVEEGVTSQVYGALSSTAEVQSGEGYLQEIVESLHDQGIEAHLQIVHAKRPSSEIVRVARELHPDLIVMGAHGHKGLKDMLLGATIDAVRHELDIPILVVRK